VKKECNFLLKGILIGISLIKRSATQPSLPIPRQYQNLLSATIAEILMTLQLKK